MEDVEPIGGGRLDLGHAGDLVVVDVDLEGERVVRHVVATVAEFRIQRVADAGEVGR